jgi:hypothetical protein
MPRQPVPVDAVLLEMHPSLGHTDDATLSIYL